MLYNCLGVIGYYTRLQVWAATASFSNTNNHIWPEHKTQPGWTTLPSTCTLANNEHNLRDSTNDYFIQIHFFLFSLDELFDTDIQISLKVQIITHLVYRTCSPVLQSDSAGQCYCYTMASLPHVQTDDFWLSRPHYTLFKQLHTLCIIWDESLAYYILRLECMHSILG